MIAEVTITGTLAERWNTADGLEPDESVTDSERWLAYRPVVMGIDTVYKDTGASPDYVVSHLLTEWQGTSRSEDILDGIAPGTRGMLFAVRPGDWLTETPPPFAVEPLVLWLDQLVADLSSFGGSYDLVTDQNFYLYDGSTAYSVSDDRRMPIADLIGQMTSVPATLVTWP